MGRKRRKSDVKGKAAEVDTQKTCAVRIEHLNYKVCFAWMCAIEAKFL